TLSKLPILRRRELFHRNLDDVERWFSNHQILLEGTHGRDKDLAPCQDKQSPRRAFSRGASASHWRRRPSPAARAIPREGDSPTARLPGDNGRLQGCGTLLEHAASKKGRAQGCGKEYAPGNPGVALRATRDLVGEPARTTPSPHPFLGIPAWAG